MEKKIVIVIRGGVVQGVLSSVDVDSVEVMDFDSFDEDAGLADEKELLLSQYEQSLKVVY